MYDERTTTQSFNTNATKIYVFCLFSRFLPNLVFSFSHLYICLFVSSAILHYNIGTSWRPLHAIMVWRHYTLQTFRSFATKYRNIWISFCVFREMATTEQSVSVASNPSLGSAQDTTPASHSPSISPKDKGKSYAE